MPNETMTATEGVEAAASAVNDEVQMTNAESGGAAAAPQEAPAEGAPVDVQGAYKLGEAAEEPQEAGGGSPGDAPEDGETPPEEEYKIEWPEGVEATEEFTGITTSAAKAAGLDSKAAGAYTAAVLDALRAAEAEVFARDDAALKRDWGAAYEKNMRDCKAFTAGLIREAGLTGEDVAVLQSPKGYRLLHALCGRFGEQAAHGVGRGDGAPGDSAWAHEVMHNPQHPDYKAFHDVRDVRHREVDARYNRVVFGV